MSRRVAYYAHHHGSGHLRHAQVIARNPDIDLLIMTSGQVGDPKDFEAMIVRLPPDEVEGYVLPVDSPFHYAPVGPGAAAVQNRFVAIHSALDTFRPDVVVVDVSCEVAMFAKLCGYPVVVRRMHGDRTDLPHRNTYSAADAIVGYFPQALAQADFASSLASRAFYLGMAALPLAPSRVDPGKTVTVLTSLGGSGTSLRLINDAAARTPDWLWHVAGVVGDADAPLLDNVVVHGIVANVAALLSKSDVIVTSAGHNAVRSAAAARRGVILAPEARPFVEQLRFAQAIERSTGVQLITDWDTADWPSLLRSAAQQQPDVLSNTLFVPESVFHRSFSMAIEFAINRTGSSISPSESVRT